MLVATLPHIRTACLSAVHTHTQRTSARHAPRRTTTPHSNSGSPHASRHVALHRTPRCMTQPPLRHGAWLGAWGMARGLRMAPHVTRLSMALQHGSAWHTGSAWLSMALHDPAWRMAQHGAWFSMAHGSAWCCSAWGTAQHGSAWRMAQHGSAAHGLSTCSGTSTGSARDTLSTWHSMLHRAAKHAQLITTPSWRTIAHQRAFTLARSTLPRAAKHYPPARPIDARMSDAWHAQHCSSPHAVKARSAHSRARSAQPSPRSWKPVANDMSCPRPVMRVTLLRVCCSDQCNCTRGVPPGAASRLLLWSKVACNHSAPHVVAMRLCPLPLSPRCKPACEHTFWCHIDRRQGIRGVPVSCFGLPPVWCYLDWSLFIWLLLFPCLGYAPLNPHVDRRGRVLEVLGQSGHLCAHRLQHCNRNLRIFQVYRSTLF